MKSEKDQQQEFQELADWIIDQTKKAGAKDCKVNLSKRRFVEINYRDRQPEVIKEATTQNLNLQVFINNRFASQSTPDFRKTTLTSFISDVVESAKIMEEDPYRTLPDPKYYAGRTTSDLQLADPDQDSLTPDERHQMAKTIEKACLDQGGSKVISVEAGEYDETYEEFVKSSNGFIGANRTTQCWIGASMTAQDEGDRRPAGYHWVGCRYRSDLPSITEVGNIAAKRTLDLMGGKKIGTETLPIIIENRGVERVLGGLFEPMSAGNIQQKRSFLADKKGQVVASKLLTIQDDPFINRALGSRYYDNDGFPAKKRTLLTEGTLNDFLTDWYYSRKLGWEPTSGSISNLIIPPGKRSMDEIVKDVGRCIVITGFIGGNSNATTGDFSKYILAKYIKESQRDIYESRQVRMIIENLEGEAVGAIDLFDFDPFHFRAGVGILIHKEKDRKMGYATDALLLLCTYASQYLRLHQLFANISVDNLISIQLFKKCGFELTGTKKDWRRTLDGWKTELFFQKILS